MPTKGPTASDIEKAAQESGPDSLDTSRTVNVPKLNLTSDDSARTTSSEADKARLLERENRELKRKVSIISKLSILKLLLFLIG